MLSINILYVIKNKKIKQSKKLCFNLVILTINKQIFPDGRKSKDTFHAVVAVDVMSDKGFGHPLLMMYLFKTSNKSECRKNGGKPIESKPVFTISLRIL